MPATRATSWPNDANGPPAGGAFTMTRAGVWLFGGQGNENGTNCRTGEHDTALSTRHQETTPYWVVAMLSPTRLSGDGGVGSMDQGRPAFPARVWHGTDRALCAMLGVTVGMGC